MSGDITILVVFVICLLTVSGTLLYVLRRQQRNIDDLNDRLMARSYTEYKSTQVIKEDDVSPIKVREEESKGWYDQ